MLLEAEVFAGAAITSAVSSEPKLAWSIATLDRETEETFSEANVAWLSRPDMSEVIGTLVNRAGEQPTTIRRTTSATTGTTKMLERFMFNSPR
jgi:hypothetical protein